MSIERGGVASREPGGEGDEKRKKELLAEVDEMTGMILERKYGAFLTREDKQDARQEVQMLFLGLLKERKFNLEKERNYVQQIIAHALINFLRKYGNNERRRLEARRLEEYARSLAERDGGSPWEKIGMNSNEWHALVTKGARGTRIDLKDGDLEEIASNQESFEERIINEDRLQKMLSFLEKTRSISERNRQMLKDYYIHGKTYKEIGKKHNVTESRASQIVKRVREILEEEMKKSQY